ncbi:ion channel [Solitalea sp. MAHUQ-68]|uniref:Ion channel n=1 Tax=Solitalea agri TaxID=2953739 RepID=A0A9X2JB53_9SPHI|nr:ion channel [Solitalea agri]MCO4291668.1 ion channel [Solitalea agri]
MNFNRIKNRFSKDELHDLGFSEKLTGSNRSINNDGSFNVKRVGSSTTNIQDVYNSLITMSWGKFGIIVLLWFILINSFFAIIYLMLGTEYLNGAHGREVLEQFLDCFFFSAQTLSTVGYGHLSPSNYWMSGVAAFECLLGLLGFALATGLLYGRFSRPGAKVLFSKNIIIAPYKDGLGLMFRIVNGRKTQLIETELKVIYSIMVDEEGRKIRRYFDLKLERAKVSFFPMSWTVVHPVDEKSILSGYTQEQLLGAEMEILISVKAFDEIYSQTVYSRHSYVHHDLVWGARFVPMISQQNGHSVLSLDLLHEYEKTELPQLIIEEASSD